LALDHPFPPTRPATLQARENRFVVLAEDEGGRPLRLHLPNSGRLRFLQPGTRLLYVPKANPKTQGRVLLAEDQGHWVLLDSAQAEAALKPLVARLGYRFLRPQPGYAEGRFDALVEDQGRLRPLEMKSATHVEGEVTCFPDAPSARARKHLAGLEAAGGLLIFALLNPRARAFRPCPYDPAFAHALRAAARRGLELHAIRAEISPEGLRWAEEVPVYFSP